LCAGAVRIAHQFAMENPMVWASMIDAEQFTELAIHNNVTRVPKTIINGIVNFDEPLAEGEFLEYVLSAVR
ncbi:MAG: thioredoxin family protein, partial [Candidatus Micrarchaeota archaeon]|nr:thioredoxin family protein [Candidatus Micrarchaeota archaeon]